MNKSIHFIQERYRRALGQIPFLKQTIGLIWKSAPGSMVAWLILLVLQGIIPVATVYLTRLLVDALVVVVEADLDWDAARPVLILVVLMALILLLKEALRSITSLVRTAQSEQVRDHTSGLIHQKSAEVDLSFYDAPEYFDKLHRARIGANYRTMALLESFGTLLQNGITLVAMVAVLVPYGIWLPVALLISTLPVLFIVLYHRIRLHNWEVQNTPDERRSWYYDWLLTTRETAAEVRLFALSDYFRVAFQKVRQRLRSERVQLVRDQGVAELGAGSAALVVTGLAMLWMVWRVYQSQISLGDLALFYQAFNQGQSLMRAFLENMGEIYSNSFFLSDLFSFLTLQPQVQDPPEPIDMPANLRDGIRFENVRFNYPGNDRKILNGFNLYLPVGQVTAIVGPNGAGKSTLIKLLCRFYDPQEGRISIDDINLKEFSVGELRKQMAVLFQEPVNFSASARENIAFGDLEIPLTSDAIPKAAQLAGADIPIHRLPNGYDTLLGRWFAGGADLSVGEWQRIALARAFLRQAPLVILDEPTSAMDPWAEADWLSRFRKLVEGLTALIITHRFTTAAYADVIYMMDDGQIVEGGTPRELLALGGRYASSWNSQYQRWANADQNPSKATGKNS